MNFRDKRVFVAGSSGMVGSAVIGALAINGYNKIICRRSGELDLRDQQAVNIFFENERPELVIVAAAKVGGILANNTYRAEFIYDNLAIELNVIQAAHRHGVEKLVFLGSSCIYPRDCPQPIREEYLLTGSLEPSNEPYAIAKIAGIKLCENFYRQYGSNFVSVMPTNLYGPNDNFDLKTSHVIPALIRKFHDARLNKTRRVELWGTGSPRREFLYVDDLAKAIVFILENVDVSDLERCGVYHLNIGSGSDLTIHELARLIAKVVGFEGEFGFDPSMPDGTPRKLLDTSRMEALGWKYSTTLEEGVKETYDWYLANIVTSKSLNVGDYA
jgi:GDP-L-fucose synthase